MKIYSINRWGELYENSQSRKVENLQWVPIPNRHDGENYRNIMNDPDGSMIFSAWNLLLQVASKCNPRGVLIKDNKVPHTATSLATKTSAPVLWFEKGLNFLVNNTDWVNLTDLPEPSQLPPWAVPRTWAELNRTEGNGTEGKGDGLPKEVCFWNTNCGTLYKVASMPDGRYKHLRSRRQDPFWVANYEQAVLRVQKSDFLTGRTPTERGWVASFDWMLRPDTVAKIMEGKYDNVARPARTSTHIPDAHIP